MYRNALLLFVFVSLLSAASIEELFTKGNSFYQNKQYDSAAVCYDEALSMGQNSVLLYNRGNCAYRLGNLGEAILLYERALLRDPDNRDAKKSLAFVETQIVDKKIEEQQGIFQRFLHFVQRLLPIKLQFWVLFFLSLGMGFTLYVVLFCKEKRVLYIYLTGLILFAYLLVGGSLLVKVIESEENNHAIILAKSSDAVNEPLGKTVIFTAHEGTKVAIIKNGGEWIQVALNNGSTGWMRRKDLGFIQ